jgi:hypothetical protein
VRTVGELRRAIDRARPESTILLDDGIYQLDGVTLDIPVRGLVLRGRKGQRSRALVRGRGMDERMVAISVSAPDVTVADLNISQVGFHGIQVRGERGATHVAIHHVHILDTGQQLIKGSGPPGTPTTGGLVACSTLEYTDHSPSDYTNGVDVLNGDGWVVRDNVFRRIRGPREQGWRAGPTVLFWAGSRGTVVERNLLLDCYRGIALGLLEVSREGPKVLDHRGGVIRRNVVCNLNPWPDEAIEVNAAPGVLIEHNTILSEGRIPWSISVRFASASARVRNNLTNHAIVARNGARVDQRANVVAARRDWFVDPGRGDLRLARGDLPAIDAGTIDSGGREKGVLPLPYRGTAPDAGAFEYQGK